jgi:hypothetical protein
MSHHTVVTSHRYFIMFQDHASEFRRPSSNNSSARNEHQLHPLIHHRHQSPFKNNTSSHFNPKSSANANSSYSPESTTRPAPLQHQQRLHPQLKHQLMLQCQHCHAQQLITFHSERLGLLACSFAILVSLLNFGSFLSIAVLHSPVIQAIPLAAERVLLGDTIYLKGSMNYSYSLDRIFLALRFVTSIW